MQIFDLRREGFRPDFRQTSHATRVRLFGQRIFCRILRAALPWWVLRSLHSGLPFSRVIWVPHSARKFSGAAIQPLSSALFLRPRARVVVACLTHLPLRCNKGEPKYCTVPVPWWLLLCVLPSSDRWCGYCECAVCLVAFVADHYGCKESATDTHALLLHLNLFS